MFPLSCARERVNTSREQSAHKKTWNAHKWSFPRCFAHISYTSFQTQMSHGKMLHKEILGEHRLSKLEGTLVTAYVPCELVHR